MKAKLHTKVSSLKPGTSFIYKGNPHIVVKPDAIIGALLKKENINLSLVIRMPGGAALLFNPEVLVEAINNNSANN